MWPWDYERRIREVGDAYAAAVRALSETRDLAPYVRPVTEQIQPPEPEPVTNIPSQGIARP